MVIYGGMQMNDINEDIKILEEYLFHLKKFGGLGLEIIKSGEIIKFIDYKQIQAIENLIKRIQKIRIRESGIRKYET